MGSVSSSYANVMHAGKQLIFPDIQFTCSGQVVKWIIGAWRSNKQWKQGYPELQIWRPIDSSTFKKVNGTLLSAQAQGEDRIYEFVVSPPLPFQQGDILGVFQPTAASRRMQVYFDGSGNSVYYYITDAENEISMIDIEAHGDNNNEDDDSDESSDSSSNQNNNNNNNHVVMAQSAIPLVTVEIGELVYIVTIYRLIINVLYILILQKLP